MSEILGHDCDGRELRAGDRVVFVKNTRCGEVGKGECFVVIEEAVRWPDNERRIVIDYPGYPLGASVPSRAVRLINSGRELFDQCAREADKMPTESIIRQRMPWTEPEES